MKIIKIEGDGRTRLNTRVPYIEERDSEKNLWGVFDKFGNRMNKAKEFEHEPFPSSRTDEWIEEHSFTFQEAIIELEKMEIRK